MNALSPDGGTILKKIQMGILVGKGVLWEMGLKFQKLSSSLSLWIKTQALCSSSSEMPASLLPYSPTGCSWILTL